MTETLIPQIAKPPSYHQLNFLANVNRLGGTATPQQLGPQISQDDNAARQTCKRRGWVTFDRRHWRLTDAGRRAIEAANARRAEAND